ncbi:hypothetical protein [Butyrivibrio fibrisolvens]|uniref:hypothetical protein n=1 Tax=Butyrivibrio fibrisolvens TaxID=831 RepID=UPI000686B78A|nr:hypothetical protein [Butyrivibrio fibrisolvens]
MDKLHNEGINDEFDAWLTFLGCDDINYIGKLIEKYPSFTPMYQDLYDMCLNVEEVMKMFSKELQELDRNTVIYMIDELQDQLDNANASISEKDAQLSQKDATISQKDATISQKDAQLSQKDATISQKDSTIADLQAKIKELEAQISH